MEKDVLNKEQEHLTKTYNKLLDMKNKLQEQIDSLNEKAVDDKTIFVIISASTMLTLRQQWKHWQKLRYGTAISTLIM